MADPVAAFYDRLAADHHLIYPDREAAIARQARVLDRKPGRGGGERCA